MRPRFEALSRAYRSWALARCERTAMPRNQPPAALRRAVVIRGIVTPGIQGPLLGESGVGRPFRLATVCGRDQVGGGAGVKAIIYDRYGSPELLRVEEVPVPSPRRGPVPSPAGPCVRWWSLPPRRCWRMLDLAGPDGA